MTISPQQFEIHPTSGVPIYRQVIDQVQALAAGGQLEAGDMLPSVRQMASVLSVNPMTISKAYARMEADGIVERVRGKGMAISELKVQGNLHQRQKELSSAMQMAIVRGRQLKLTDQDILNVVEKLLKEISQ
ncbi:GntR family transcriptional regulator [Planctomicrobium sp. SH668]|uniref:GntR family transcriptional regulator n=1 Tax=Planctomicrobium sp. SH668 TaxID=3448126 RepID=UPI003F5BFBCF